MKRFGSKNSQKREQKIREPLEQEYKIRKYIMKLWKPLAAVCSVAVVSPVFAETPPCSLKSKTETTLQGTINQTRNIQYSTKDDFENHRRCLAVLDVEINGEWHSTSSSYTFGPDVSETEACERALTKAKTAAVRAIVPQTLTDMSKMVCDENPNQNNGPKAAPLTPVVKSTPPIPFCSKDTNYKNWINSCLSLNVTTASNGDTYVGEWKNGRPNGEGTYTFADGTKYVGKWKDGKAHGQGTETSPNGDKYVGEWKNGKLISSTNTQQPVLSCGATQDCPTTSQTSVNSVTPMKINDDYNVPWIEPHFYTNYGPQIIQPSSEPYGHGYFSPGVAMTNNNLTFW
jgi:hypothetical protein